MSATRGVCRRLDAVSAGHPARCPTGTAHGLLLTTKPVFLVFPVSFWGHHPAAWPSNPQTVVLSLGTVLFLSPHSLLIATSSWLFLNISVIQHASESPGGLKKRQGATPEFLTWEGLEWGPGICMSNKLPGAADAAGPGTMLFLKTTLLG